MANKKKITLEQLTEGTRVEYMPIGGGDPAEHIKATTGTIKKVLTHEEAMMRHRHKVHIHADEEHPRVLLENEHTGKEAAVGLHNIVRVLSE